MTIREYAKSIGHEVVGKLTRRSEFEWYDDGFGGRKHEKFKFYVDEAGNEYYHDEKGICIVTTDGNCI